MVSSQHSEIGIVDDHAARRKMQREQQSASSATSYIYGSLLLVTLAAISIAVPLTLTALALSPLLLAILLGMALGSTGYVREHILVGTRAVTKPFLQAAIILLGMQITVTHLLDFGLAAVAIMLVTVASTVVFTIAFGRLLGVDRKVAQLISAGTSICGASAVVATNSVVGASREDVAYVLACITLCGTISMLAYPPIAEFAGIADASYGLWTGLSIHEVGQVVVAGFQVSDSAGEYATAIKLGRIVLLAPLVLTLGFMSLKPSADGAPLRVSVPWFVVGFIALIVLNSVVAVPQNILFGLKLLTTFLFAMALAGIGLDTNLTKIKARSMTPLWLAAAASIFISVLSLALISAFSV